MHLQRGLTAASPRDLRLRPMTADRCLYRAHWLSFVLVLFAGFIRLAAQSPPPLLSYQGRLVVNNINFDGQGYFKFALVQSTNGVALWSNDGAAEPNEFVPLSVSKGL